MKRPHVGRTGRTGAERLVGRPTGTGQIEVEVIIIILYVAATRAFRRRVYATPVRPTDIRRGNLARWPVHDLEVVRRA